MSIAVVVLRGQKRMTFRGDDLKLVRLEPGDQITIEGADLSDAKFIVKDNDLMVKVEGEPEIKFEDFIDLKQVIEIKAEDEILGKVLNAIDVAGGEIIQQDHDRVDYVQAYQYDPNTGDLPGGGALGDFSANRLGPNDGLTSSITDVRLQGRSGGAIFGAAAGSVAEPIVPVAPPNAVDDDLVADEGLSETVINTAINIGSVLGNDSDSVGAPLFVVSVTRGTETVNAGQSIRGQWGSLTINADGTITYDLDDTAAIDAWDEDSDHIETFTYVVSNGGFTSTATLTINVQGHNDAPRLTITTNDVAEDANVGGNIFHGTDGVQGGGDDAYDPEDHNFTVTEITTTGHTATADGAGGFDIRGQYGDLHINADGTYTYTYNANYTTTAGSSLGEGETAQEVFNYTATDENGARSVPKTLTITLTGTNDAPIVQDETTDEVTETGSTARNAAGNIDPANATNTALARVSGNVLTNDIDLDHAAGQPAGRPEDLDVASVSFNGGTAQAPDTNGLIVIHGKYGALVIDGETGAYTYVLANGPTANVTVAGRTVTVDFAVAGSTQQADLDALPEDTNDTEEFDYTVTDGHTTNGTAPGKLTITVHGANDAPTATNDAHGTTLIEAGAGPDGAGPNFDANDLPGTISVNGSVLGNDTDVDTGDTADTFTVVGARAGDEATGGSPTGSVNAAGGNDAANATEVHGQYGNLIIDADGNYTYVLANDLTVTINGKDYHFNPDQVQNLAELRGAQGAQAADEVTDTFTYAVTDSHGARDQATLSFKVQGTNDRPVITGLDGDGQDYNSNGLAGAINIDDTTSTGSSAAGITDIDGNQITQATFRISSPNYIRAGSLQPNGTDVATEGDVLSLNEDGLPPALQGAVGRAGGGARLQWSWDVALGLLTVTGNGTKAEYEAIIRNVQFSTDHLRSRNITVDIRVNDGTNWSEPAQVSFGRALFSPINDTVNFNDRGDGVAYSTDDYRAGSQFAGLAGDDRVTLAGGQTATNNGFEDGVTIFYGDIRSGTQPADITRDEAIAAGGADTITGGTNADIIFGQGGNDLLFGNAGGDTLSGGEGNDLINGGAGGDDLRGGNGLADTLSFEGGSVGIVASLRLGQGFGVDNTVDSFGDRYSGFEVIVGASHADSLEGNEAASTTITGAAGNDTLLGGAVADSLDGGADDDLIVGRGGADRIDGGAGINTASYEGSAGVNVDLRIVDAAQATQASDASGDIFVSSGGRNSIRNVIGSSNGDIINGDTENNVLDGGAGGDTDNDRLFGNGGADTLRGQAGADSLDGGIGNDSLDGGTGDDRLFGGSGNENANDTLNGGDDTDLADYTGYQSALEVDYSGAVKMVIKTSLGGTSGDRGTDILTDVEHVLGTSNNDKFYGGAGATSLNGAGGTQDTISYERATSRVSFALNASSWTSFGAALGIAYANMEVGIGSDFADTIGASENSKVTLRGEVGDDILNGLVGHGDSLIGGDGADTIIASSGTDGDTIDGGDENGDDSANDVLSFANFGAASGVRYDLGGAASQQIITGVGAQTITVKKNGAFSTIEHVIGGDGNDTITGDSRANSLFGGLGADSLIGGDGNDTLSGEDGNDVLDGGLGRDSLLGGAGDDRLIGTVLITDRGTAGEGKYLDGDSGAETIGDTADYSRVANNINIVVDLNATTGSAILNDGTTTVTDQLRNIENFTGGGGNDTMFASDVANRLDGGDGIDRVDYSRVATAVGVNLAGVGTAGAAGDRYSNIEWVVGTALDDTISATGTTFSVTLDGGAGRDSLTGGTAGDWFIADGAAGAGADTIVGGGGADTVDYRGETTGITLVIGGGAVTGGSAATGDVVSEVEVLLLGGGDDSIRSGSTSDTIYGGEGNDTLEGRGGADYLDGGSFQGSARGAADTTFGAHNTVSYAASVGLVYVDLNLQWQAGGPGAQNLGGAAAANANGDQRGDILYNIQDVIGTGGNDTIVGDNQNNFISGGLGADSLLGGIGNDTIDPGALGTTDVIDGGAGFDFISFQSLVIAGGTATTAGATFNVGFAPNSIEGVIGSDYADSLVATNAGINAVALYGDDGNDTIIGGAGDDTVSGGAGADTVDGGGNVSGSFYGDVADYSYVGNGTSTGTGINLDLDTDNNGLNGSQSGVIIVGDATDVDVLRNVESIIATKFNDTLQGDHLGNIFEGGLGADSIDGQGGFDYTSYQHATSGVRANLNLGTQSDFTTAGAAEGDILINVEGLIGSAFNDSLTGRDGQYSILVGGAGADTFTGGVGGATRVSYRDYYGTDPRDITQAGLRIDLHDSRNGTGDARGDVYNGIREIEGTRFADVIYGDSHVGAQGVYFHGGTVTSNSVASNLADTIIGGWGADTIEGGSEGAAAADVLDGGTNVWNAVTNASGSIKTLLYSVTGVALNIQVADAGTDGFAAITSGLGPTGYSHGYLIRNFNRIVGTDRAAGDVIRVNNSQSWIIDGGAGTDLLVGGRLADTIIGGLGADTIQAGAGSNRLVIDINDTVLYSDIISAADGGIRADLSQLGRGGNGTVTHHNGDVDTLVGNISALTGGANNDTIIASTANGQTTIIEGGAGADSLVGDGNDHLSYASDTTGVNVNVETGTASGGDAQGDWIGNSGDRFWLTLTGGIGNDTLTARDAVTGAVTPVLNGGAGNDILNGGAVNDILYGGSGADTLNGGGGFNTAHYGTSGAVTVDLRDATGNSNAGDALGDRFTNIQQWIGSGANDRLIDSDGATSRWLDGGAGADTLDAGNGGTDTLVGGAGDDRLFANGGSVANAIYDGGSNFDRLTLRNDLNLTNETTVGAGNSPNNQSYNVRGIEVFDLNTTAGGQTLTLSSENVAWSTTITTGSDGNPITNYWGYSAVQNSAGGALTFVQIDGNGASGDRVVLQDRPNWTNTGTTVNLIGSDGANHTYDVWRTSGTGGNHYDLAIQQGVFVT